MDLMFNEVSNSVVPYNTRTMNTPQCSPQRLTEQELTALRPLARLFPSIDLAVAEIARLSANLTLPMGTIHVISDIHGEHGKLRHIINNASGTLRPLVERLFGNVLAPVEMQDFLSLIFYPRETLERDEATLGEPEKRRAYCQRVILHLLTMIRTLSRRYTLERVEQVFPAEYRQMLREMLHGRTGDIEGHYVAAMVDTLAQEGRAFQFIRLTVRVVRNLAIDELIIAGDFWDRGPRGDRVMDYVMRQPNVAITWGNHDAAWLGACLGHEALIAHVLRISLRYRRLSQLEEGYGILMQPLEHLVRTDYSDDPAECFRTRGAGLRDDQLMARMHKAAAIMQFKLEGKVIERNPQFDMVHRRLLHHIDFNKGTVTIDGVPRRLRDTRFPTIEPTNPYALSPEERSCLGRIRQSFLSSQKLLEHMHYMVNHGAMHLCRDDNLIFHGCVPVDEQGVFLPFEINGQEYRGRDLFDAIERVVVRCIDHPVEKDLDLLWYLWCGPRSPLFGKDRITTLENDLIDDKTCHIEKKNPYFHLIHDVAFCKKVLAEFGADSERGLIVNGHVPVKIEEGESPLKRSGKAITIDGAFSEAYGDHGYTLVLEADRTFLAKHHHFESVEAAVKDGVDIIPAILEVRHFELPRRVGDTEKGAEVKRAIELLQRLLTAYRTNKLRQG
jgi:fructose-1,6-bisphosphatase III